MKSEIVTPEVSTKETHRTLETCCEVLKDEAHAMIDLGHEIEIGI